MVKKKKKVSPKGQRLKRTGALCHFAIVHAQKRFILWAGKGGLKSGTPAEDYRKGKIGKEMPALVAYLGARNS